MKQNLNIEGINKTGNIWPWLFKILRTHFTVTDRGFEVSLDHLINFKLKQSISSIKNV